MGALIAAVGKDGSSVSAMVLRMLQKLSHRGSDGFTVASSQKIVTKSNWDELHKECPNSHVLLGHNFSRILNDDGAQSMLYGSTAFVFEGRLFQHSSKGAPEFFFEGSGRNEKRAIDFVRNLNGAYVFALCGEKTIVGRDVVGTCPLYFGESEEVCAVATERKALWEIGIAETNAFRPGMIALIDRTGFHFKSGRSLVQPRFRELDMESAAQQLCQVLAKSTERCVSDVDKVAVAYSGGIDSVTVAMLAKLCNVEIDLVCVTLPKQREAIFAERTAKVLNLPFHLTTYSEEDVEKVLPKVLWLTEEPDPVGTSIAIPMFWAAEQSVKLGCRVAITGQGGDELFGGYH
ncbi:MAG: asparagine synthase-related protein, partial [Candidatus Bathyarchaeota archaeon]|nr:asparagine synthase-related protein [Candidatus Bathyarchaeota archaeon]